jgi:hypothetical protein
MVMFLVSSIGYVNLVKANPAPLGYPSMKIDWSCSNNTLFTSNNVNMNFNISSSDTLITYGYGGLQPNYTVITEITGIVCRVDNGKANDEVSENDLPGTYSVEIMGLSEGSHNMSLVISCKYNYSEQFNQDIKNMDIDHLSHITTLNLYFSEPIYFTVHTNQEPFSIIPMGIGISLAVIATFALVVVFRKYSLKVKVKGDGTEKET